MKAILIEFEIGYNNQCEIISYRNMSFETAYNKLKRLYKDIIIYNVKTEY